MIWILSTFFAYFIKGLCGFANSLVFSSILSFQMDNIDISPTDLLLGYPSNIYMTIKERNYIDKKLCSFLTILMLAGSIPGIFILKNTDTKSIKLLFGFVIVGIGIQMIFQNKEKKPSKVFLFLVGIGSGLLCGLFGIGALLSAYISRVTDNTHAFKANMCMVFTIENTMRILLYFYLGILHIEIIKRVFLLFPIMALGLYTGIKTSSKLNEFTIQKIITIMLILSGMTLILKNI